MKASGQRDQSAPTHFRRTRSSSRGSDQILFRCSRSKSVESNVHWMPSISVVQQYAIPPDQPGGTRHFEFAKVLEKLGWTTQILASDFSHHEKRFFRREARDRRRTLTTNEQGVSFVYFWIPEYENNGLRRMVSMMWFSLRVFLRILTKPDDVIYASSPHIFCCASSWLAAKIRRRPFVFEVRDLWPEHFAAVSAGSVLGQGIAVARLCGRVRHTPPSAATRIHFRPVAGSAKRPPP